MSTGDTMEFGKAILAAHFPHMAESGVTMLNSGSFGIAPKFLIDRKIQIIQEFESYGDNFVRQRLLDYFAESVRAVAELLNLRPEQCTLVDNVTTGVSNLLDSCCANISSDSAILVNSWTYGSVKVAAELSGAGERERRPIVEVDVKLPLASPDEIIDRVRKALDQHPEIRIAIFDHITSGTACVMPVNQLSELCHSRGVLVIIDGAHAIGQLPNLDIPSLGADFYVGNLHKWLFAPKSAALLWASDRAADGVRPSIVSWLVREPEMSLRFAFLGTRDTSSLCSVSGAVDFVRNVCGGLDRIHAYCSHLADEASQHLTKLWGTEKLPIPEEMQAPFMRLIALPEHLQLPEIIAMTRESKLMSKMWDFVLNKLKMDILLLNIEGRLYIRISCAIIVCMDDIRKLGLAVMKLSKEDFLG